MLSHPHRLRVRQLIVLALAALLALELSGVAEARDLDRIQRDLADARERREQVEEDIAAATTAYEELVGRIARLEVEGEELEQEVTTLRIELGEIDELVTDRLRAVFKHGSNLDPLSVFLASDDPSAALSRAETVQRAVVSDRARTEDLAAARTRLGAAEDRLTAQREEVEQAREEQQQVTEDLEASFSELGELVGDLESEEQAEKERLERERLERERRERERREQERQERLAAERRAREPATATRTATTSSSPSRATSAPARTSGGMACPLDQPRSFIDSWGHARSGGRAHRGTDLMGPRGIPVRAITNGVWSIQRTGRSAGLWAILRADNGDHFWYLHLDSHTVSNGARVTAGQQVGTNGSTGNATAGGEHVHFEWHPGGGRAVNPYPLLRSACG